MLLQMRNDVALQTQLITQPRPNSRNRILQWLNDRSERTDIVFFIVAAADDNRVLGYVQLSNLDVLNGRSDLGICMHPTTHGSGAASKALHLLEDYVHQVFGIRKIVLQVLSGNGRAISFYLKQGFTRVGVMREHAFLQGCHMDVLIMEKFL